jgi:D-beta-D-heptose 7-phosphate kinase / D-beta-D-heptose 1-phosphate adenosyltransferase
MTLRLLVVGDTLLDRDVAGRVERVCPDAPVPVLDVTDVHERPGGAGLAALLASRSGVDVVLATGLGPGRVGARVHELLDDVVDVHDMRPGTPTVCKTRVRSRGQSLLRLDDDGRIVEVPAVAPAQPRVDVDLLRQLLRRCDVVLVSDYGGPVTRDAAVRSLLAERAVDVPVVWDPHPRGHEPVAAVAVCTPNRAEARHFASAAGLPGTEPHEHARALQRRWRSGAVCVTDGERGAVTALDDGELVTTRTLPCPDGTDTCGAGDRFAAGLAVALGRGSDVVAAVAEAQRDVGRWLAAGGVNSRPAPGAPGPPVGAGHTATPGDASTPVPTSGAADPVSAVSADKLVEAVRARGGTVVATGGCFDVLHAGHLGLLQQARTLGDCLVVLLNSDASVRRLKGPARPVHSAADRARLLEALACVDAVAVFEDDDPIATLAHLRPDVWVKGGDYREDELPEARTVRALGGRIALVPYLDGHSTTRILQHLDVSGSAAVISTPLPAIDPTAATEGERR